MRVALSARTSAAGLGRIAVAQLLAGRVPSLAAIARHLRISRRRVRARLQELGLLPQSPGSDG